MGVAAESSATPSDNIRYTGFWLNLKPIKNVYSSPIVLLADKSGTQSVIGQQTKPRHHWMAHKHANNNIKCFQYRKMDK